MNFVAKMILKIFNLWYKGVSASQNGIYASSNAFEMFSIRFFRGSWHCVINLEVKEGRKKRLQPVQHEVSWCTQGNQRATLSFMEMIKSCSKIKPDCRALTQSQKWLHLLTLNPVKSYRTIIPLTIAPTIILSLDSEDDDKWRCFTSICPPPHYRKKATDKPSTSQQPLAKPQASQELLFQSLANNTSSKPDKLHRTPPGTILASKPSKQRTTTATHKKR